MTPNFSFSLSSVLLHNVVCYMCDFRSVVNKSLPQKPREKKKRIKKERNEKRMSEKEREKRFETKVAICMSSQIMTPVSSVEN